MYLISDNVDTCTGMRLAGIDGLVVHERDILEKELERLVHDSRYAIILITEKLCEDFSDLIDNYKSTYKTPLFVEIPDRHGSRRGNNFIMSMVNEAIGQK